MLLQLLTLLTATSLSHAQTLSCLIDVALIVDESGSIQDTDPGNWALVTSFLTDIVSGFDIGPDTTHVALITFGNDAFLHFDFDDYAANKPGMVDYVENLPYRGGNTNTTGGLKLAREVLFAADGSGGDRPDVADVVLLMTDGRPTRDVDQLFPEVNRLKQRGTQIVGVGVTDQVNTTQMLEIVSNREDYFTVANFSELSQFLDQLITQTCRTIMPSTTTTTRRPPGPCSEMADMYLVMDGSGSIGEENFRLMKTFASDFVDELTVDSGRLRVGLTMFSNNANIEFNLNSYNTRTAILNHINGLTYPRGTTNTAQAISLTRDTGFTTGNGERTGTPNIMVILTDGNSNDQAATIAQATQAKQRGIHIITLGIGNWTNVNELRMVASYPYSSNYIPVASFQRLDSNLRLRLTELVCDNVNECLSNPCRNGATCVNAVNMYLCQCPTGFAGLNCDRTCRTPSDVVFAIDSSGSIGQNNFLLELEFVRNAVLGLNTFRDSRVGALQYSDNARVEFQLNTYTSTIGVLNGLSMQYLMGTTNTAAALQTMRQNMFTSENGERAGVPNVAVVITDGRPNDYLATWNEAMLARAAGIQLMVVGVGGGVQMSELRTIASDPTDVNVLMAPDFARISSVTDSLLNAVCNNVNGCASPNPCRNEGSCTDLINSFSCECLSGFSGLTCERRCDKTYDIIFAIDSSGSIRNERFPTVLDFVASVVSQFEVSQIAARVGAIIFSDNAEILFHLNRYNARQDVISHIRNARFMSGRTNIAEAMQLIRTTMFTAANGDRANVNNWVVVLTDGGSNERVADTIPMSVQLRQSGANVLAIGVGTDVNILEIQGMASLPQSRTITMAPSFTDIAQNAQNKQNIINTIVDATCDPSNQCLTNPCRNGAQCLDAIYTYYCQCPTDFSGENCDRRCTRSMDVAFVLDFSGSLDQVVDVVIAFTKAVVQGLPFAASRARVGVITYSDTATILFDLDDFTDKRSALNALSFNRYGGRTNTQAALTILYQDMYTPGRGDRSGTPNIAIVLTDGGSNISRDQTVVQAREARNRGIEIYVVAMHSTPDMMEVNEIASDPDSSHVVRAPEAAAVDTAAQQLLDRLCA